ncbi:hypothetical protein SUGI_0296700 [Cryptomeria japonica]|nr:hypothetical protein SUGI_0296700 [Cryptomeria japonica]
MQGKKLQRKDCVTFLEKNLKFLHSFCICFFSLIGVENIERKQLASVLNFCHVFRPVLEIGVKFSAEDLEAALITPNAMLSDIHISLLKDQYFGSS